MLRVDPDRIGDYLEGHETVWPAMLEALRDSGYRNYSIFVDESGLIVGYLETDDFEATLAAMSATEVNAAWGRHIGDMFLPVDDARPVGRVVPLRQAFDLDSALDSVTT
nr:L-rhamnose mutarotase [Microbacterium sp. CFH 90308]